MVSLVSYRAVVAVQSLPHLWASPRRGVSSTMSSTSPPTFLAPLSDRAVVSVMGQDATIFLQNFTTNDVVHLDPGKAQATAFLNVQGRVLVDALLYRIPNEGVARYLLDVHVDAVSFLLEHLQHYKLRSKIDVEDATSAYSVWCLVGGGADESSPPSPHGPPYSFVDPRLPALGVRTLARHNVKLSATSSGGSHGPLMPVVDARWFAAWRIANGIPEGPLDIVRGKSFPLESNLDYSHSVCFSKGCYVGQELTGRTHRYGAVRRRVVPVVYGEGPCPASTPLSVDLQSTLSPPLPGTDVMLYGTKVGWTGSTAFHVGMAVLRQEDWDALRSGELRAGGLVLRAVQPSWWPKQETGTTATLEEA